MTANPAVAILIATYNGEKYLRQQLDSILYQTYQNFKIYISDDSSSDSTVEILSEYQKKYPDKIFYSINEQNIGFLKNFEKLLLNCSEQYISLSDQDDIWLENKLEIQMKEILKLESLNNNGAFLVHSDLSIIDENNSLIENSYFEYRHYKLKSKKDLGHILGPCGVMGNTILLNRELIDLALPFPEQLNLHDYWIAIICELFGERKTLNQKLVKYRIHTDNFSNSQDELYKNNKKYFTRDIKLPNLETKRKYYLPSLLNKVQDSSDIEVLNAYIDYLTLNKNRLFIYFDLLKYSLVKRDIVFRIKLLFKIIFTNRY